MNKKFCFYYLIVLLSVAVCGMRISPAGSLSKSKVNQFNSNNELSLLSNLINIATPQYPLSNSKKTLAVEDEFKWMFDISGSIVLQPVIDKSGTIYAVASDVDIASDTAAIGGELVAIEPNSGEKLWSFKVNSKISASPVIGSDGTLFLSVSSSADLKSSLSAINSSGSKKWGFESVGQIKSAPLLDENKLFLADGDSTNNVANLYSINLEELDSNNVTPEWVFTTEGVIETSPLVGSGLVIAIVLNKKVEPNISTIYAFDKNNIVVNGSVEPKWAFQTEGLINSAPVIMDNNIYVSVVAAAETGENKVLSVNIDGQKVYEFKSEGRIFGPVIDSAGVAYVGISKVTEDESSKTGFSVASKLIAIKNDGSSKWEFDDIKNGTLIEIMLSSPVISSDGNNVLFGTGGVGKKGIAGNIFSVDTSTGSLDWVEKLNGVVMTPPLAGNKGTIYAGISSGTFDKDTKKLKSVFGALVSINESNGDTINTFETKGAIIAPLNSTDVAVYAGSLNLINNVVSGTLYSIVAEGAPIFGSISGLIADGETGDPVLNATVSANANGFGEVSVKSNDEGMYIIPDLLENIYSLSVSADGFETGIEENIEVATGEKVTRFLTLKPTTNNGFISGTVIDFNDNKGIKDVTISTDDGVFSTKTGDDGGYKLSEVPKGIYTIEASSDSFVSEKAELIAVLVRNTTILDFILRPVPPVAEFNAQSTTGQTPLTVSFTDESVGNINNRLWVFGDGDTSAEKNPEHVYVKTGVFSVILTVTGPGGSDTIIKPGLVNVQGVPVAGFEANSTAGFVPFAVQFKDLSVGDISNWSWNFGDGGSSTAKNPLYTYETEGAFTVTLDVTEGGGTDSEVKTEYIKALPIASPLAEFTANKVNGFSPFSVQFSDLSSGQIDSWLWGFGDGDTSSNQSPAHEYKTNGDFEVTLTVTGPGGTDSESKSGFIRVLPAGKPKVDFSVNTRVAFAPLAIQFTDLSEGIGIKSWIWDFGDGDVSSKQSPSHEYKSAGFYTPEVAVAGNGGTGIERKVNLITAVSVGGPVAEFSATPNVFFLPDNVQFSDLSEGEGITSWSWNFGDGGFSTTQNPVHTYNIPGNFTVSLTVSNENGVSRETKLNIINAIPEGSPLARFSASPLTGFAPLEVRFNELAEPADSIDGYFWDFGDGAVSSQRNPVHVYKRNGIFNVSLTVSNVSGANTRNKTNLIRIDAPLTPVADFKADKTSGIKPVDIELTDLSEGDIDSWNWLFGDGGVSDQQSPTHTYTRAGIFFVSLTVSGPGGTDIKTKTNFITIEGSVPVADFSATPTVVEKGSEVQFTDLSTGGVTGWLWDFGDGGNSEEQNPKHAYKRNGKYNISLTASGTDGSDREIKTNFITVGKEKRRDEKPKRPKKPSRPSR